MKYDKNKIKEQLVDEIRTLVAFQIEYDHAEKLADWIISDRQSRPSQALEGEWPSKTDSQAYNDYEARGWARCHDAFMAKIKNVRGK